MSINGAVSGRNQRLVFREELEMRN